MPVRYQFCDLRAWDAFAATSIHTSNPLLGRVIFHGKGVTELESNIQVSLQHGHDHQPLPTTEPTSIHAEYSHRLEGDGDTPNRDETALYNQEQ